MKLGSSLNSLLKSKSPVPRGPVGSADGSKRARRGYRGHAVGEPAAIDAVAVTRRLWALYTIPAVRGESLVMVEVEGLAGAPPVTVKNPPVTSRSRMRVRCPA